MVSVALALACGCSSGLAAEKTAHIGYVYPAGGGQGTEVTVVIGGENVYGAQTALVSGAGVSAVVLDSRDPDEGQLDPKKRNKRKNEAVIDERITVKVCIASNAVPGNRDLCLATTNQISNKLVFQVGELQELNEAEPNNKTNQAVRIDTLPVLVQGQIMPGDVDRYRFHAAKGQRLVVEVSARELLPYIADGVPGWFQAIVSLADAGQKEVAVADDFRFRQDPVLFYDVPRDGDYVLSIRDTLYRGREDFVYRMRLGELPFITGLFPLGGPAGTNPVPVRLSGVNLPGDSLLMTVEGVASSRLPVFMSRGGLRSNRRLFAEGTTPEVIETRPALKERRARTVLLPVVVNGCLRAPGERHFYRFEGKQGDPVHLEVLARRLGSPLDSCLILRDDRGKKIAENDDVKDKGEGVITHQSDSALTCVLPQTGAYTVEVRDTQGGGGEEYAYRLRISPPQPDFALRLTPAAVCLPQGGSTPVTVHVIRREGFDGEIQLSLAEPRNGLVLDAVHIPAGMDKVTTTLSAPGAKPGRVAPRVIGTAPIGGRPVSREAVPAENLMQAFIYQHLFPFDEETVLVMDPPAPFRVTPQLPADGVLSLTAGQETSVPVSVSRRPGYDGPIRLQGIEMPKGLSFRPASIPPGKDFFTLFIRADSTAVTNRQGVVVFSGSMPVEREATPLEKAMKEARAAREKAAREAVIGSTNAAGAHAESTNAAVKLATVPQPASDKPVMVTRPVVMVFPAMAYRITDAPVPKPQAVQSKPPQKPKPQDDVKR